MTNQLNKSSSPYLKQHENNPVHWLEWSKYALEKAKAENKPIIVSIGYSACHWCHVMAHESFEDEATAKIMNDHFINIKIDREEHPDLDAIYMDACQLVSGNGGWPLNAFALPDGSPFHAGTYFKKHQWQSLLMQIAQLWRQDRSKVNEYAKQLKEGLNQVGGIVAENYEEGANLKEAVNKIQSQFDLTYGGLNRAPKFPMPVLWEFLLTQDNENAQQHSLFTLEQMAMGGINDWVEGGFARYSVDGRWFAPHFEKMLYDNGQLIQLFTKAYSKTKDSNFLKTAESIFHFVESNWKAADGGYFSALDADSEGVEGKYYCLTHKEIEQLAIDEKETFKKYFQLTEKGNWEHGMNILYPIDTPGKFEKEHKLTNFETTLTHWRKVVLKLRKGNVKPELDDKQNTTWNALYLSGLCTLYAVTKEKKHGLAAQNLAQHLTNHTYSSIGELQHIIKDGRAYQNAFLEDYAFGIQAMLDCFETFRELQFLETAKKWTNHCFQNLLDEKSGFFIISNQQKIVRQKVEVTDNVIPSSNSIMCENLLKLAIITGNMDWFVHGEKMLETMQAKAIKHASFYANWCKLLFWQEKGFPYTTSKYVLENKTPFWMNLVWQEELDSLTIFEGKNWTEESQQIYFCKNHVCMKPVSSEKELNEVIKD